MKTTLTIKPTFYTLEEYAICNNDVPTNEELFAEVTNLVEMACDNPASLDCPWMDKADQLDYLSDCIADLVVLEGDNMRLTGKQIEEGTNGFFNNNIFTNKDGYKITGIYKKDGHTYAQLKRGMLYKHNQIVDNMLFEVTPER